MKKVLGLCAALAIAIPAAEAADPWSIAQINKQIDLTNMVVGDEMGGFCSGTVIDVERRLVMTAAHCTKMAWRDVQKEFVDSVTGEVTYRTIREKKELEVWHNVYRDFKLLSANHYRVKIIAESYTDDMAVLQILDDQFTPPAEVKLAEADAPTRGDHVWLVSNPYVVLDNSLTEGRVSGENRSFNFGGKNEEFFQHDAVATEGSSGGVLINDHGEMVGTHVRGNSSGIGLGVPVGKLKKLLISVNMRDVFDPTKSALPNPSNKMDDR